MNRLASITTCLALAACSTTVNPPSLLPRAIETRTEQTSPVPVTATVTAIDPAVIARLDALTAEARAGNDDFAKAQASGRAALAAGRNASTDSEDWIAAELVVSALQIARQRSASALADLDTLSIDTSQIVSQARSSNSLQAIAAAQATVETIVAQQTAALAALGR